MQDPPGVQEIHHPPVADTTEHLTYSIEINKETYSVQHLTFPKSKVDLDSETLKRVRLEQKEMANAFHHVGTSPLWDGAFLEPVNGHVTGVIWQSSSHQRTTRRPHSGEDIAAPEGTPVLAINKGIVVTTVDHFFSGKGVILDHGVGLFSMYFHLSEIDVQPGQTISTKEKPWEKSGPPEEPLARIFTGGFASMVPESILMLSQPYL